MKKQELIKGLKDGTLALVYGHIGVKYYAMRNPNGGVKLDWDTAVTIRFDTACGLASQLGLKKMYHPSKVAWGWGWMLDVYAIGSQQQPKRTPMTLTKVEWKDENEAFVRVAEALEASGELRTMAGFLDGKGYIEFAIKGGTKRYALALLEVKN